MAFLDIDQPEKGALNN